jgi:hypothetical protein
MPKERDWSNYSEEVRNQRTCNHCKKFFANGKIISVGHRNGKTFYFCTTCLTDPFRDICGDCGKILWEKDIVRIDEGPYCTACRPNEPIWKPEAPEAVKEVPMKAPKPVASGKPAQLPLDKSEDLPSEE